MLAVAGTRQEPRMAKTPPSAIGEALRISRGLKFSTEEVEWFDAHRGKRIAAMGFDRKLIGASVVNGMQAQTQWAYNADRSTRGAMPKPRKRAKVASMPLTPKNPLEALKPAGSDLAKRKAAYDETVEHVHELVLQAHAEGASLRSIAEAAGISHQRVHQIIQKGQS